ncbi:hypothetical protein AR158_C762L [Paramecium bursaria Chlorella virus AR158]|uniref:hypothetical protein n=1 Tax=Paramecium bursaria Chlorella virus AR158 TaxID=380598 RepID=UPI00015AA8C7|nr:hypothetical protein AR158_C762L [Paramecium bursaria Chlorella virus AR158]ABU44307.1 hypothetical protein AR158_C762L [Paramecium bursaria Chlorella virus AR158]
MNISLGIWILWMVSLRPFASLSRVKSLYAFFERSYWGCLGSSVHARITSPGREKQAMLSTCPFVSSFATPYSSQMIFSTLRYSLR